MYRWKAFLLWIDRGVISGSFCKVVGARVLLSENGNHVASLAFVQLLRKEVIYTSTFEGPGKLPNIPSLCMTGVLPYQKDSQPFPVFQQRNHRPKSVLRYIFWIYQTQNWGMSSHQTERKAVGIEKRKDREKLSKVFHFVTTYTYNTCIPFLRLWKCPSIFYVLFYFLIHVFYLYYYFDVIVIVFIHHFSFFFSLSLKLLKKHIL